MTFRKSACQTEISDFNARVLAGIAEKYIHMFHVSMHDIILVDVAQTACNLLYYALSPVLRQHFDLVDAQVVHQVAPLCQLCNYIGELALTERLDETYHIFAILALKHCVRFRNVVLLFQLAVLRVLYLFNCHLQSCHLVRGQIDWVTRIVAE